MSKLEEKLAALEKMAEPCAKLGISRADTAIPMRQTPQGTSPCIGYTENRDGEMCEMCRDCESSFGYPDGKETEGSALLPTDSHVIVYHRTEDGKTLLDHDLKYWSNSLGELYNPTTGECIEESDLPEELQNAYRCLWMDGIGSYCCLVEYKGRHYVALINEFYDNTFEDDDITVDLDTIFHYLRHRADSLSGADEFAGTKILVSEYSVANGHKLIVLVPWDTPKERMDKITELLNRTAYHIQPYVDE